MGSAQSIAAARSSGEAYLLERRLMYGLRSGEVVDPRFLRFGWHPNWEYDVLRALDYFRGAGASPDPRMAEAVAVVRKRAHGNGLWPLNRTSRDPVGYHTETAVGEASRWNTLRALRVLDWFDEEPSIHPDATR
jgi:hypothetical protein